MNSEKRESTIMGLTFAVVGVVCLVLLKYVILFRWLMGISFALVIFYIAWTLCQDWLEKRRPRRWGGR